MTKYVFGSMPHNGSLETNHMFSEIWARDLGLITTSLVSGSVYQLVSNSMEAHDLLRPVTVARNVEYCHYWIKIRWLTLTLTVHVDDDFETSTRNGFTGTT